jgi:hypothetical protein
VHALVILDARDTERWISEADGQRRRLRLFGGIRASSASRPIGSDIQR